MPAKTTRIFIDTNVWFSAYYGSENCQAIVNAHQNGNVVAVISSRVLDELVKNIRNKLPQHVPTIKNLLTNAPPEITPNPTDIPASLVPLVSPKDLPIFAAAMQADVDYFITGNIKDFKRNARKKVGKLTVLAPKEAVKLIGLTVAI